MIRSNHLPASTPPGSQFPIPRPVKYSTTHLCSPVRALPDDDADAPRIYGDWREFRAKLIAKTGTVNWSSRLSEENYQLLQIQNPKLAAEELWAHATPHVERGGLLLSTRDAPLILGNELYWQVVVLLVQHGPAGSVGLILNRPSGLRMAVGRGGLPMPVVGAPQGMQEVFADNRLYCGGLVRQDVFHVIHGHNLEGSMEISPGVYVGGDAAAVKAVREGLLPADDFKFFSGACIWVGDGLQREIDKGIWYTAAASRPLVLKQVLQLPKPLWKEILMYMGQDYATIAAEPDRD